MTANLESESVCPECGGRGWLLVRDGSAGTARPCACRHRNLTPSLLDAAAIPLRYRNCSFKTFDTNATTRAAQDQLLHAKSISERYVRDFIRDDGSFTESGLLFIGPPGVGKTHLAVAVLRELIESFRVRGLFVDFTSLMHKIQSTFDPGSPESKRDVLDPVTTAEVLVLDELGAQKPTPWVNEILYLIMNGRYTRRLPTLFTTNFRLEGGSSATSTDKFDRVSTSREVSQLASRISASLLSRLYEMARPIEIDVEDFRREVQMQKHRV